ncbi:MAG: DUF4738 domain-containing protein [Bacteroidales bacterium]|nr:DUF4738 domain-containing protein [Bacteroidales bacterium]
MPQPFTSLLLLACFVLSSCGQKSSTSETAPADNASSPSYTAPPSDRDSQRHITATAEYRGHRYTIDITSTPDAALPKVKDSYGDDYLDNRFRVVILRDGAEFSTYTFTKAQFEHLIATNEARHLILGGIAYKEVESDGFSLGAQLNAPGDEEGGTMFEITLPLAGQGSPYIERDNMPDVEQAQSQEAMD